LRKAVRVRIRGLVHGVFFRASLSKVAIEEGVTGWVKNVADGSVEAFLEGEEQSVNRLVDWCRHGPPAARVDSVEVTVTGLQRTKGFMISG